MRVQKQGTLSEQIIGSGGVVRSSGQLSVLTGLALLLCVAAAFASLATWSVDDPSFSNASPNVPQNILGFAGSAFADLSMQFLGLASAIALIPPAIWGWMKLIQRPVGFLKKRLIAWPLGLVALAGAFGCLSIPATWPLPSGLGGVIGDMILKVPGIFVSGYPSGWFAAFIGLLLTVPGLGLTLLATGLIGSLPSEDEKAFQVDPETGEILDDDEPGWARGAITHWYLSFKARRKKHKQARMDTGEEKTVTLDEMTLDNEKGPSVFARTGSILMAVSAGSIAAVKGARSAYDRLTQPEDDGLENFGHDRAEPDLHDSPSLDASYAEDGLSLEELPMDPPADPNHPAYGETVYRQPDATEYAEAGGDDPAGDWAPQPAPPAASDVAANATQVNSRVTPQAPPPKPGNRVVREAQPSFIPNGEFELPSINLLSPPKNIVKDQTLSTEALEQNARMLEGVLDDFGVKGEIINVRPGPVVTLYELEPAPGIKSSRVIGLADDIARSMSAIAARVAVVPGRNAIGIELPNSRRETVYLREMLASENYEKAKSKLPLILGKTIGGEPTIADLAKMPHLLVAGTTGSGKSVAINTMILSILYRMTPEQVKMIMIDPKMLELSIYDGIPHLLTPVVTDPKKAVVALKWTVREMEERYKKMSKLGVRNIDGFNQRLADAKKKKETITRTVQTGYDRETGEAIYETEELELEPMPYIIVIIDEMADLMMVAGKDIEGTIQRLAQMARAAGIHVIMATQRPSVDVITGTIKANFPTRISFQVTSKIDSRTILGEQGAEQLLGMGDMLYMAGGGRIQRVHGPFVADDEVESIVTHLKTQGVPQYLEAVTQDDEEEVGGEGGGAAGTDALSESNDVYDQAVAVVLRDRKVSTSYIQRRLSIGYNRAASLIERMEQEGLISAANHAGKREILVPDENETI